jgi:tetratricopeptide (TPR) repeat protein
MHAAKPGEAVGFLERAVREHQRHDPEEVSRGLVYLATALRLAGDPTAAFAAVERALSELEGAARHNWAQKTRAYLELERGRCLLSLGRPRPALAAFEWAADACEFDHEHPRSAALRGLASAHRLLGNAQSSEEYFERCCGVATEREVPLMLRQVAAMAIADRWLANARITSQLRDLWIALFPGRETPELIAETRQAWIY